jgi:AbrB family looped-hinge helix DNA binding protein
MDVRAKITSKGQVTIPKSVRDDLQLDEGDEVQARDRLGRDRASDSFDRVKTIARREP